MQDGGIEHGRIQDGYHHQVESKWMSLSQIELVWVRVLCKMAESRMTEFKMATIIKLQWEGMTLSHIEVTFDSNSGNQILASVEWVWEESDTKIPECKVSGIPTWQCLNSTWLPSSGVSCHHEWVWVRLNEFESVFLCKMGESKMGDCQHGCSHQVESRMNDFEPFLALVWVRVLRAKN